MSDNPRPVVWTPEQVDAMLDAMLGVPMAERMYAVASRVARDMGRVEDADDNGLVKRRLLGAVGCWPGQQYAGPSRPRVARTGPPTYAEEWVLRTGFGYMHCPEAELPRQANGERPSLLTLAILLNRPLKWVEDQHQQLGPAKGRVSLGLM